MTEQGTKKMSGRDTPVRRYVNEQTGTEVTTYLLHVDRGKQQWWAFEDLFTLPFIRQMAAKKVLDLYGNGLALDDITAHTAQLKLLLKGTEADKYERAYAKVLELEGLATAVADPVKQCLGLCTVYLLLDDERPDVYSQGVQAVKFTSLAQDVDAQAFFLRWWTDIMRLSGPLLSGLSRIVSTTASR